MKLQRVLFVDNEPSDVLLEGAHIRGIPQGCPIACGLCNLYSLAWHQAVYNAAPVSETFSYLDDRLAIANSWDELSRILVASMAIDRCFGPKLNMKKTIRGVA